MFFFFFRMDWFLVFFVVRLVRFIFEDFDIMVFLEVFFCFVVSNVKDGFFFLIFVLILCLVVSCVRGKILILEFKIDIFCFVGWVIDGVCCFDVIWVREFFFLVNVSCVRDDGFRLVVNWVSDSFDLFLFVFFFWNRFLCVCGVFLCFFVNWDDGLAGL